MILEQCEECQYFCIEYDKYMGWHYQVCKNPECMKAFGSDNGFKIEYIKKCPMGNYDPIGPQNTTTSARDYAFGYKQ